MATYPVKYINNDMRGAPVLSGTAGALISVLDAFLITGFGQVTALSVTVSGGIATASLQAGQSFNKDCVVLVDGATPAALNGEQRVLTASNSAITWATTASDGAATGTITIKVAPVGGWEKKFTGTNKAVYRSTDLQASGFCVRIDDTGTLTARIRGFESMTDVDTGSGPFPTDAQISGGGYVYKSGVASGTAVRYDMIADSRTLLMAIGVGSAANAANIASPIRGFGDMLPLRPAGDVYSFAISASATAGGYSGSTYPYGAFDTQGTGGADAIYCPRPVGGIGGSQQTMAVAYVGGNVTSGADLTLGVFPSPVDGELKYAARFLRDGATNVPRANVPGVLHVPQSGVASLISARDTLDGTGALAGRKLVALAVTSSGVGQTHNGIALVDITGPWR